MFKIHKMGAAYKKTKSVFLVKKPGNTYFKKKTALHQHKCYEIVILKIHIPFFVLNY